MGTVSVSARIVGPMVSTGLAVAAGDLLWIGCAGYVDQGDHTTFPEGNWRIEVDAAGVDYKWRKPADDGAADDSYPLPGTRRYALIGGVVDAGGNRLATFAIGKQPWTRAPASGTLFLGSNDNRPDDNKPIPADARNVQTPWIVGVDRIVPDPPAPPTTRGLRISSITLAQFGRATDAPLSFLAPTTVRALLTTPTRLPAGTPVDGFVDVGPIDSSARVRVAARNPTGTPDAVRVAVVGEAVDDKLTSSTLNFEVPIKALAPFGQFAHYVFEVTAFLDGQPAAGDGQRHKDQRSRVLQPGGGPLLRFGSADLFQIVTVGTASGTIEVLWARSAQFYQAPTRQRSRFALADAANGTFQMVRSDLCFIKTRNTGSGRIEVHIASGASNYTSGASHAPCSTSQTRRRARSRWWVTTSAS